MRELDREMIEINKELVELESLYLTNAMTIKEKKDEIASIPNPPVITVPAPSRKRGRSANTNTVDTNISFIAPKKQGGILYSYFTGFNGFAVCATINDDNTYKAVVKKQIATKPNTFTVITSAGSVSTDSNSGDVSLNGTVNLKISNNPVISNTTISARVADGLQQFYLNYAAQLIKATWQGNMALEMNDSIDLTIKGKYYSCVLVGNRYIYDGGMRCESLLLSV
jgi:hypothetical protein